MAHCNGAVDVADQRWYCLDCWDRRQNIPTHGPGSLPLPGSFGPAGTSGVNSPGGSMQSPTVNPGMSSGCQTPLLTHPWGPGPPPVASAPTMIAWPGVPQLCPGPAGPGMPPGMPPSYPGGLPTGAPPGTQLTVAQLTVWRPMGLQQPANLGFAPCEGSASQRSRSRSPHASTRVLPEARKYTSRFIIGIENEDEFRVVRRIIGSGGAKMKEIVARSGGEAKLRLRGRGSGYVERDTKAESHEPLQLCVSCPNKEGYEIAVRCVEELLRGIYEAHAKWCADRGLSRVSPRLRMTEQHHFGASKGGSNGVADINDTAPDGSSAPRETPQPAKRRVPRGIRKMKAAAASRTANNVARDFSAGAASLDHGKPTPNAPPVDEITRCIDARNEARRKGEFGEADRIRSELRERGVILSDERGRHGVASSITSWRYWHE